MNKLIVAFTLFLMASIASAQSRRSLKDIDRELKQTKSTATAMALIESIADTTPQTDEDVATLSQLMDRYPTQGQKALAGIKDPKLAKAIMKECGRQVAKFRTDKDKDWKTLPEAQRWEKFNALLNSHAMIAMLGNLKNKEALPFLKQYITPEYDGILSYEASQAIGRIAPDDPAVFKELWDKQGMKNISYNAYGNSVLKEVAQKMQASDISQEEKHKILVKSKASLLGGRSKEEKALIKDILLNHKDIFLREEVSVAMVHAVMNNPEEADKDFVLVWAKQEKSLAQNEVVNVMDIVWDKKFVPDLVLIMQTGTYPSARAGAAQSLGQHQIKESLPYLEECVEKDKAGNVRGACREAYWKITGKIPVIFHPDDVNKFDKQFNDPVMIELYSKTKADDPVALKRRAIQQALKEFNLNHPTQGRRK